MNKLLQLQQIMIDRLQDINIINQYPQCIFQPSPMKSISPLINANPIERLQVYRKRESMRLRKELLLNQYHNYLQYDIKYISKVCINVMKKYDKEFDYVKIQNIEEVKVEKQLAKIFIIFFQKHASSKQRHLIKIIKREQQIRTYFNYIVWLLNWSRNMFFQSIRQPGQNYNNPKNTKNMYFQRSLRKQQKRKVRTQPRQQPKTIFFSKQHLYSHIKSQMQAYYESFSNSIDLDEQFIKKISYINKKDANTFIINDMVSYLAERNAFVAKSVQEYTLLYRKAMKPMHQQNKDLNGDIKNLYSTELLKQKQIEIGDYTERISVFNFIRQNKVKKSQKSQKAIPFRSSISHSEESYRHLSSRNLQQSNFTRIYSPISKEQKVPSRLATIASKLQEQCNMHKKDYSKAIKTQGKQFILSSFKLESSYIKQQSKNNIRQNWCINKRFQRNFTNLS